MDVIYREERDRWVKGDRHVRPLIRRLMRGESTQRSGMQMVVRNFLIGLRRRRIAHAYNRPFFTIGKSKTVISFGLGIDGLKGLPRSTPVIAAIGFPYPAELPDLCRQYNVRKYLQHSKWTLDFAKSARLYDEAIFDIWPAGIDTDDWKPAGRTKTRDVLIYRKIHWDTERTERELVEPIRALLRSNGYSFTEIAYGGYSTDAYKQLLSEAWVMVFLTEHESQGLAYQECLASGVPVFAWDQGTFLDPIRHKYDRLNVPATSVPYFDERCGMTFSSAPDFAGKFDAFFANAVAGKYNPREFVLDNLSIERSTTRMLDIYDSVDA